MIDGVIVVDKPIGITSFEVVRRVKRAARVKKIGHGGTLDPLASGVLPVCLGEATKLAQFLLDADKRYSVTAKLGVRTATADAEGEVTETKPVPKLEPVLIGRALARFRGEIRQIPPMYSALHHQGQRLYERARQGIEVAREPREVVVHALDPLGSSRLSAPLGHTLMLISRRGPERSRRDTREGLSARPCGGIRRRRE